MIGGESRSVSVNATDAHSGLGKVQLFVDGQSRGETSNCPNNQCTLSWTPGANDADGVHTLKLRAVDRTERPNANEAWSSSWQVVLDRNNPTASATQTGLPAGWFDSALPTARVSASDQGAGVKRLRVEAPQRNWRHPADGQPPKEYSCTGTPSRCPTSVGPEDMTYNTAGNRLPEGVVSLRATATDASPPARSGSSPAWTARVDHTAPSTRLTGTLAERAGGALTDASYNLRVAATDGSPTIDDTKRSGVKAIRIAVDGQTKGTYNGPCDASGCRMDGALDFTFNADQYTDGEHVIEVTTKDQLGDDPQDGARHTKTDRFEVLVDRRPPSSVTAEQLGLPAGWFDSATPSARITATDAGSGIQRLELDSPDSDGDPAQSTWKEVRSYGCGRDGQPRCPKTRTDDVLYNGPGNPLPEGMTPIRASAFDAAGRGASAPAIAQAKVDRTPPSVVLSGSLKESENRTLYAGAYLLDVRAADGGSQTPRSGVKGIRIFVDNVLKDEPPAQPCDSGSCPMSRTWAFHPDEYGSGWHTIRVESRDQLADQPGLATRHTKSETFRVQVGDETARVQDRTGLENFYQYDTTETGGETRAHVNLATGNLVWHSVPIVNPGRGLSTVVNLTYNAQERPTDFFSTAGVLPYNQVGRGFSLAISGLTRVNEPLDLTAAAAGVVKLTDPDGTNHVFRQSRDGITFLPPPGVNLHLRRFAPLTETDPVTGAPKPVIASKQAWAITRADGVTYYFDQRGYPSSIEDRNGNALSFRYSYRSKATGVACDFVAANVGIPEGGPADDLVCKPWLDAVEDAGGRRVTLTYDEVAIAGTTTGVLPGKVKAIRDHGGRVTALEYDPDPLKSGDLVGLVEAKGTTAERRFRFAYEPLGALASGTPDRDLVSVNDPRGTTTQIAYASYENLGSGAGTGQTTKRVGSITDRRGSVTRFDYGRIQEQPTQGVVAQETAKVVDARGQMTQYRLDRRARMIDTTDPRGVVTALTWDEDNNATSVAQARGTADEAVTRMEYNPNGLLTANTRAAGTSDARRTELRYDDGAGTQLTERKPLVPPTPPALPDQSADAGLTFVSDLTSIKTPAGGTTTLDPDARGNVVVTVDPEGHEVRNSYDGRGQVTEERAFNTRRPTEEGAKPDVTTYSNYDANGLPQLRTDPRGNETSAAGDGEWRYAYDEVGNLLTVTDPRGGGSCAAGDGRARFTTKLTYDSRDRLLEERIPKRSEECVFVTKTTTFDRNDNVETTSDGEGAVTTRSYTAMDELREVRSPSVSHFGETAPAEEVTRFYYDAEGNRIKEERPNGTKDRSGPTAPTEPVSYSTSFTYDSVGQRIVETRNSRGGSASQDLSTSFAHDLRGNVVGVVDPRRNAGSAQGALATNALDPARRRLTLLYDRADNRVAQIEDPAGKAYRTEWRYDLNDNQKAQIEPRGFEGPAPSPDAYTTRFAYDRRDLLTAITDAKDHRTAFELRPDGRIAAETKPKGTATTATAGDYETRYSYNANGELASRSLPWDANQYGSKELKVTYRRNAVGDPIEITDARGNSFTNSFFDTGELRTTGRPSWWKLGSGNAQGGGAEAADILERNPEEMGSAGEGGALPESTGQGDFGAVDAEQMPDWLPKKGLTTFDYDDEMRLTEIRDGTGGTSTLTRDDLGQVTETRRPLDRRPEGTENDRYIVTGMKYDRHGNLRRMTDPAGYATTVEYDQFDRPVEEERPGSPQPEVSKMGYDENGNMKWRQTPRGADFTERMAYDLLDRVASSTNPAGERTTYAYDAAGNQTLARSPRGQAENLTDGACDMATAPLERDCFETESTYNELSQLVAERDGLGHETRFGYDANGNEISVDAPGASAIPGGEIKRQVMTRRFDGRDLLWAETTGSGSDSRTTVTEYDPNGNLRRTVKPAGVDEDTRRPRFGDDGADATREAELREYSPDNLLTSVLMPWGMRDEKDQKRYRQDFTLDERGHVESIDSPYPLGAAKAGRTSYTHFDTGWIRSQTDPALRDPDTSAPIYDQAMTYDYDRRGNQTLWRSDKGRKVTRAFYPSGMLERREAYKTASDQTPRTYTYAYNANRSRTQMVDDRPTSAEDRTTNTRYDAAERETVTNEAWSKGKDTLTYYDADGNPASRRTDGRWSEVAGVNSYAGGKQTTYAFDPLGRETRAVVDPAGGKPSRTTSTAYWPSGARQERVKPNGVAESYFFGSDGQISRMRRQKPPSESFLKDQAYTYDRNGNRTTDERGSHAFNARDQLTRWTKKGNGGFVDYELNGSGAITKKTEDDGQAGPKTTSYDYVGDRLTKATRGDATTTYAYDDFGAVREIKVKSGQGTAQPKEDTSSFAYDEFERMTNARGPGLESDTTYTYDGLDRRDSRCEANTSADAESCTGQSTDYSYVGASELLSQEEGGGKTLGYDYDSGGDSLGQTQPTADDPATYRSYAKDANGSVEGLEDSRGEFGGEGKDRYDYDPYGALENEDTLSQAAKANPLRFEGFYYDEGLKAYDMQARPYKPDVGRFLTQDRYESARGDYNLQSDPLTGNRYAFAGGNPVSRVEWDGHCAGRSCGPYSNGTGLAPGGGGGSGGGSGSAPSGSAPSGGAAPESIFGLGAGQGARGRPPAPPPCRECTGLLTEQGRTTRDGYGFGTSLSGKAAGVAPAYGWAIEEAERNTAYADNGKTSDGTLCASTAIDACRPQGGAYEAVPKKNEAEKKEGGISFETAVKVYSLAETVAFTAASASIATFGTAACVAGTAGTLSVACAGIALTAGSATVAGVYATYREAKALAEGE